MWPHSNYNYMDQKVLLNHCLRKRLKAAYGDPGWRFQSWYSKCLPSRSLPLRPWGLLLFDPHRKWKDVVFQSHPFFRANCETSGLPISWDDLCHCLNQFLDPQLPLFLNPNFFSDRTCILGSPSLVQVLQKTWSFPKKTPSKCQAKENKKGEHLNIFHTIIQKMSNIFHESLEVS